MINFRAASVIFITSSVNFNNNLDSFNYKTKLLFLYLFTDDMKKKAGDTIPSRFLFLHCLN